MTTHTDGGAHGRYKALMDNGYRAKLEREIDSHGRKIAELSEELQYLEGLARLLRVALKGRRAAQEIAAERLAQEYLAMKSLIRG